MKDYTRRCIFCKEHLPDSAFAIKPNNTRDSFCRECKKTYQKKHYADNKQYYKDRATAQKKRTQKYIREIKATTPCNDCGGKYHFCVMDFDHREGETKLFDISKAWQQGRKKVEEEIAKCDVVCANCHRIRTYGRAGHFDYPKIKNPNKGGRLTPEQKRRIIMLYATGRYTHKQLAQQYGKDRTAISHLLAKERDKTGPQG